MATIFFSWQSDTPNRNGRTFLENALKAAIGRIAADLDVEAAVRDELALDRDTKGVPGQPPIVETIFKKIDRAAVFVPDLTFVGLRTHTEPQRPTPNPNVLIEYGWALKKLGYGRIVPVMNVAYGRPEGDAMPFDMRHLRNPICYDLPPGADAETVRNEGQRLAQVLERALRDVLESPEYVASLPKPTPPPPFPAAAPRHGQSRFRAKGEALGISDRNLHFLQKTNPPDIILQDGPSMWLRLMPATKTELTWSSSELKRRLAGGDVGPLPLYGTHNLGFLRAPDGVGTYNKMYPDESTAEGAAFLFKTGEIWGVEVGLLAHMTGRGEIRPGVPFVEPYIRAALDAYARVLERLGLARPFRWIAGLEGVKGHGLWWPAEPGKSFMRHGPYGSLDTDIVFAEGTLEVGDTPTQALKPFFKTIFDHCGFERGDYLDTMDGH